MSNETKWTPGPWECNASAFMSDHSDTRTYFVVTGKGLAGREKANAQLIAAAPDLYDVLSKVLNAHNNEISGGFLNPNEKRDVERVLAKARGE